MIKLNKITDYAVVILGLLSSRYPNKFSTSKISEDTGLPVPTVAKVCKLLNKANLILAGRGANGGYYCEIAPSEINVADIVESIVFPVPSNRFGEEVGVCIHAKGDHSLSNVSIIEFLKDKLAKTNKTSRKHVTYCSVQMHNMIFPSPKIK